MSLPLALITGGTSGIGLSIARRLRTRFQLALIYARNEERARAVEPGLGTSFKLDLTQIQDIPTCLDSIRNHFQKPVGLLINSAGIAINGRYLIQTRDLRPLQEMMKVNYLGSLAMIDQVLPEMLSRSQGVIVNLASASSLGSNPGLIGYSESKAALRCLSRNLAVELAGTGVSVHCLSPARVTTPMTAEWLQRAHQVNHPLDRALDPEEVAGAVEYLVQAGPLLNGLDLILDGGHSLTHSPDILRELAESEDERLPSEDKARPR